MLEPSERRRLREIERGLQTDDPEFAELIDARSIGGTFRHHYALMVAGVAVTAFGLFIPACYAVGLSIALTGLTLRLTMQWLDRRGPVRAEGSGDDRDPASAGYPSKLCLPLDGWRFSSCGT